MDRYRWIDIDMDRWITLFIVDRKGSFSANQNRLFKIRVVFVEICLALISGDRI